jgi:hypothetical protein
LSQTLRNTRRAILIIAVIALAALVVGCGNSGTDTAAPQPTTSASATTPHVAASGPAVNVKLSIDQLTLDSPIKHVTDKNGLVFLHFRYTDNDGKVYDCVLPNAQGQGQYTPIEWISTFNAYRLPKVVAQKKVNRSADEMHDFPFIAPKPQEVNTTSTQTPQPSAPNISLPTLPSSGASPAAAPGAGGLGMPPPGSHP